MGREAPRFCFGLFAYASSTTPDATRTSVEVAGEGRHRPPDGRDGAGARAPAHHFPAEGVAGCDAALLQGEGAGAHASPPVEGGQAALADRARARVPAGADGVPRAA